MSIGRRRRLSRHISSRTVDRSRPRRSHQCMAESRQWLDRQRYRFRSACLALGEAVALMDRHASAQIGQRKCRLAVAADSAVTFPVGLLTDPGPVEAINAWLRAGSGWTVSVIDSVRPVWPWVKLLP